MSPTANVGAATFLDGTFQGAQCTCLRSEFSKSATQASPRPAAMWRAPPSAPTKKSQAARPATRSSSSRVGLAITGKSPNALRIRLAFWSSPGCRGSSSLPGDQNRTTTHCGRSLCMPRITVTHFSSPSRRLGSLALMCTPTIGLPDDKPRRKGSTRAGSGNTRNDPSASLTPIAEASRARASTSCSISFPRPSTGQLKDDGQLPSGEKPKTRGTPSQRTKAKP